MKKLVLVILVVALVIGCGGGSSSWTQEDRQSVKDKIHNSSTSVELNHTFINGNGNRVTITRGVLPNTTPVIALGDRHCYKGVCYTVHSAKFVKSYNGRTSSVGEFVVVDVEVFNESHKEALHQTGDLRLVTDKNAFVGLADRQLEAYLPIHLCGFPSCPSDLIPIGESVKGLAVYEVSGSPHYVKLLMDLNSVNDVGINADSWVYWRAYR